MTPIFDFAVLPAHLLGEFQFLLDLAVKSLVVLVVARLLTTALRRTSAAVRHWVWSVAIISLLALPIFSLALPSWQLGILPSPVQVTAAVSPMNAASESSALSGVNESAKQAATNSPASRPRLVRFEIDSDASALNTPTNITPTEHSAEQTAGVAVAPTVNWAGAALVFWLFGALLVVARLLAGTFKIRQLANQADQVTESSWISLVRGLGMRLRLRNSVQLLKSERVSLPMTWGAWRSVVMLPAEADEWPHECRSIVLLHELAHVKRRDCLTQNLAQLACALYWFNPLVWMAAKQLRIEREMACDDQVLEIGTKASDYAEHLVEIARSFRSDNELSPVAVGMACSQLESRVRSILDPGVQRCGLNRLSAGLIGVGAMCLISCLAVVQPWGKAAASPIEARGNAQMTEAPNDLQVLPEQTEPVSQSPKVHPGETAEARIIERESLESKEADEQEAAQNAVERGEQDGSQGKAQSSELTARQIIEMKAAGVTPEFVEAMRKQGFDNLTVRELVQLRVHGITDDFIKQARSWGGEKVTVREIVELKISGVTPEYISAMKRTGYENVTIRQLISMRMMGVAPEYVETMRRLGYDKLTANQLTSLKTHGVDEAFIKEMQNWTGGKPSVNELLQIKVHGVTPDYARALKSLGYDNIPINKLTTMKVHGINEQFIKEMRDLGFDKLTVEQLIQMHVHGVTADYVKKMRAAGLKNVSVNQMIEMKIHGIDEILLKEKR